MANDIKVHGFVNYTDLRQKQEVSGIEEEAIRNYAKDLIKNPEKMRIFLEVVPYGMLMEEASSKYYREHNDLEFIKGILRK